MRVVIDSSPVRKTSLPSTSLRVVSLSTHGASPE